LLALLSFGAASAGAQVTQPVSGPTPAPEKKVVLETASSSSSTGADDSVVLNPFDVITSKDRGFVATNAGTATKLGLDMKDMAAPIP